MSWGELRQQLYCPVVRGRLETIQKAGLGKEQGARADGQEELDPIGLLGEPREESLVPEQGPRAHPAGDDNDIRVGAVPDRVPGGDKEPSSGHNRRWAESNLVHIEWRGTNQIPGYCEYFVRPREIQDLDVVEDKDRDIAGEVFWLIHGIMVGDRLWAVKP